MLWLLVFVPAVFLAEHLSPAAPTLLFVLSVLAILPLAALLRHANESVAAKTGDAVGDLLNATLTTSLVTNRGRSGWSVGVLMLMVYLIFGLSLYLRPPRG